MKILLCSLIGYALGNINPAFVIGRIKGFDIRQRGSGNAGASNAVITMGKTVGIISALFDIFKAYLAVKLATMLYPSLTQAGNIAGVCCVLGHIFPVLIKLKGGKGLASLGGVILAFDRRVFLIMLLCELVFVLIVDYICFVPITASIIFPLLYNVLTKDRAGTMLYCVMSLVILYKHVENIRRIRHGTEAHLSLLWKREKEIERLSEKLETEQDETCDTE